MPYSDWHFGPLFRVFVQLKSSEEEGRKPGPRPLDRKRLDLNQAFADFSYPRTVLPANQAYLTLRLVDKRLISATKDSWLCEKVRIHGKVSMAFA
jgi:hypothetical protein